MGLDWIGFGYAALVASGGIAGYAKAGSVPSLAAGLVFGGLAGLGAYRLSENPKDVWLSLRAPPNLCPGVGWQQLSCFGNLSWYYGHEILQLRKIHACGIDCCCKSADGWEAWTEDVRKAT